MATVTTQSPITGRLYNFEIAGTEPTAEERNAIAQYLLSTEQGPAAQEELTAGRNIEPLAI